MDIMINDTKVKYTAWVADIDKDIDGIMCFDFHQRHQFVIDTWTNTFNWSGQPVQFSTVEVKSIRCFRVLVDKTSIIPPGVEIIMSERVLDLRTAPTCLILVQTEKCTEVSNINVETTYNISATQVSQDQKNWVDILPMALMAYHTTAHDSTKFSPNEMVLGQKVRVPIDLMYGTLK
ncbi:hypothetical protein CHS0354_025624 [Potamilus streckersoni]|uniref:Uncharacterized protein n=1 Tax=Potamilus streckersoni TaxID=2493646 RepID=A0AAE0S178_9BIVA|nr:hypothetical protein CHS0354_025624 [Potamilus streckersoni]